MISGKHLFLRSILSGILTVILGIVFAFIFPSFSVENNKLIVIFILYIIELVVVHCILWLSFKRKTGEKFLHRNIITSESVGMAVFVFFLNVIVNDDYNLLFLIFLAVVGDWLDRFWNALDDENKKNEKQKKRKNDKKQKSKKK